jgi:hypothetical protein
MAAEDRCSKIVNELEATVAAFFDLLTLKAAAPQPHGDDGGRQSRDSREESKRSVSAFVQCVQDALSYVDELAAQLPEVQLRDEVQQLQDEIRRKVRTLRYACIHTKAGESPCRIGLPALRWPEGPCYACTTL